ncbi:MAG: helix-turn-helix domain-containing protein [Pseudomonadota bacterium]
MNQLGEAQVLRETTDVLIAIGRRIRQLRNENDMTFQALADRTGLSVSMLSLLERGKTGPSIGTLVVIASALGAQMSDLLETEAHNDEENLARAETQRTYETAAGVTRRIVKHDRARGVEIAINEFQPGTASSAEPRGHQGYEYGLLLEGGLEIVLQARTLELKPGDLISYDSTRPHKISNKGGDKALALWINLKNA